MPGNTTSPRSIHCKRSVIARAMRSDITWLAGCVLAIAAALQLAGLAASRYIDPRRPATTSFAGANIEQAGNELLYRACVREARLKSLPVKPYPQESERVNFIHEGKRLLRETETLEADVSDMSVDNGCQVKLQRHVRTESAPSSGFTEGVRRMALREAGRDQHVLRIDNVAQTDADSSCRPQRDMALQSHYMLLSLCLVERRQAPDNGVTETPQRRKRVIRTPAT